MSRESGETQAREIESLKAQLEAAKAELDRYRGDGYLGQEDHKLTAQPDGGRWRPIETAPHELDPNILVSDGKEIWADWWSDDDEDWWNVVANDMPRPTHWMHLPPLPQALAAPTPSTPGTPAECLCNHHEGHVQVNPACAVHNAPAPACKTCGGTGRIPGRLTPDGYGYPSEPCPDCSGEGRL